MKNGDNLAMPIEINGFGQYAPEVHGGMTKREMIAMHALTHMTSKFNPWESGDFDSSDYDDAVTHAVGLADALLAELDK